MLKKLTEPQAQYFKTHADGSAVDSSSVQPPANKKKPNMKIVGGVLALALFVVVGIAGFLIVGKQQEAQQASKPLSPNAPESRPQAAGTAVCSLTFTVPTTTTPTPTPVITPGPSTVTCVQKLAYLNGATTALAANAVVKGGDTIEYVIKLQMGAGSAPTNPVVVEDQLDQDVTFVKNTSTDAGVTLTQASGKLHVAITPFAAETAKTIRYQVTVNKSVKPITVTNTANIVDTGFGVAGGSCVAAQVQTAAVGTAECTDKIAYKLDENNKEIAVSTVKPGDIYYYKVKVKADEQTMGKVSFKDVLPAGVEYQSAVGTTQITPTVANGVTTLTADLGVFGENATANAPEIKEVAYKVKMGAVDPGDFKNVVTIGTTGSTKTSSCNTTVKVPAEGVAACVSKEMHNAPLSSNLGESSTRISNGSKWSAGDTFYYRVKVSSDKVTTGKVTVTDTLPASLQFVSSNDFTANGNSYTASYDAFKGDKVAEMQVKVKDGYPGDNTNTAQVATANSSQTYTCSSQYTTPVYSCNSTCDNDDQCHKASPDFSCTQMSNSSEKRCRRTTNTGSTSCEVPGTPGPTPTPTVGCNNTCITNADCTNPSHICYQTSNGGRCRLDTNVTSESCNNPVTTVTTPVPVQPTLPTQLPVTGPADWANWLKAGLVTLGIGSILLLLL